MSELIQLLFIMLYVFEFIYVYLCNKKMLGGNSLNGNCIITERIPDLLKVISLHICSYFEVEWKIPGKRVFPLTKRNKERIYVESKLKKNNLR